MGIIDIISTRATINTGMTRAVATTRATRVSRVGARNSGTTITGATTGTTGGSGPAGTTLEAVATTHINTIPEINMGKMTIIIQEKELKTRNTSIIIRQATNSLFLPNMMTTRSLTRRHRGTRHLTPRSKKKRT